MAADGSAADAARVPLDGHRDFRKLWWAWSISSFGSLVTRTALPWAAILTLGAGPMQLGLIAAIAAVPGLVSGAVTAAWVDRLRRRPLLIAADLARALLLGSIPLAALLGRLSLAQLYVVTFLAGALDVVFDVAHTAYLPGLVRRADLMAANARLAASASVAEILAFGLAGWLVQWFSAPRALLLDALSFLASAAFLAAIGAREPEPGGAARSSGAGDVLAGARAIAADPVLRPLLGAEAALAFSLGMGSAVYMLFVTRDLGLGTGALGLLFAVGGVSAWLGARAAAGWAARYGLGPVLAGGLAVSGVTRLVIAFARGPAGLAAAMIGAQQSGDGAASAYLVSKASLVQARSPDAVRGRISAAMSVAGTLATMMGALVGGGLGGAAGLRVTLGLAAGVAIVAGVWLAGTAAARPR
jgi:MFS family permease